ncbi:hypothetical protein LTR84_009059 [Exophiala bonariae]|uniref:Uncharacterized protein n=1 Tax=Exophiala bonariae TaxID=1690606 RepID=A0AAV9MVM6_9EURO|nr:hypothetical protein LTR84_009059 [Exophiala bonariae]
MARITSRHSPFAAAVCCILSLFSIIRAQLIGCEAVGCPQSDGTTSSCPIGNFTAQAIGTANFTSAISSDPLTWTVAFKSEISLTNTSADVLERSYYLGSPASLDLATIDVKGCALIFKDVVNRREFSPTEAGTCPSLLGASCVSDLMSQANKTLLEILDTEDPTFICSKLAVQLRDNAPSSCSLTDDNLWGAISVQDITGPSLLGPIAVDATCNPTSRDGYHLISIDSQQSTTLPISASVNAFAWGVTPVVSVFYSSTLPSTFEAPEISLSCLKPVAQDSIVVVPLESTATNLISIPWTLTAIATSLIFALIST